jgi:Tfp pilus assembly protein PilN
VIIFARFAGSELTISALKCKQKEVTNGRIAQAQHFDSIDEVVGTYGKSTAYHLHLLGSGVLSRKLESLPNYKEELVINGNIEDFIFSAYDDGTTIAASFFRKALIEEQLEQVEAQKIHLLGISAGDVALFALEEDLSLNLDYCVVKEAGKIKAFERLKNVQEKALIDGDYFSLEQLLAKAIFQNIHVPNEQYSSSVNEAYGSAHENYRQFNQFRVFGVSLLTVILLSLVVNYFYQNSLNASVAQLELDLSMSNDNLALLDRLEQEKIRKEQLVFSAGVNSSRFLSYYLDEIGQTVPKQVNLQELEVFPLEGKLKDKRKVEVNQQQIRVSGTTLGNEILDDWIERMDRFDWVHGIELLNYSKLEGDRADFIVLITLDN